MYVCMYVCLLGLIQDGFFPANARDNLITVCVCVYVCMYVCMYACWGLYKMASFQPIHATTLLIAHNCMCMYVCLYVCMHVCIYVCMYVRVYVCCVLYELTSSWPIHAVMSCSLTTVCASVHMYNTHHTTSSSLQMGTCGWTMECDGADKNIPRVQAPKKHTFCIWQHFIIYIHICIYIYIYICK